MLNSISMYFQDDSFDDVSFIISRFPIFLSILGLLFLYSQFFSQAFSRDFEVSNVFVQYLNRRGCWNVQPLELSQLHGSLAEG
jgi:hypothetical protein